MKSSLPPADNEIEQKVLGILLYAPENLFKVADILRPEYFWNQIHRIIFEAIIELHRQNIVPSLDVVIEHLNRASKLQAVGGRIYLNELTASFCGVSALEYLSTTLKEYYVKRTVIRTCQETLKKAHDTGADVHEILEVATRTIGDVANLATTEMPRPIYHAAQRTLETIQERMVNGVLPGIETGFESIDYVLHGLKPGNLITIAARPAMGKSAFSMQMAYQIACQGRPVLFFSLEMTEEELVQRLLAMIARIAHSSLAIGNLGPGQFESLQQAAEKLNGVPLIVVDAGGLTTQDIVSVCRRTKFENDDLGAVVIDHIGLVNSGKTKFENRNLEVSAMTRSYKLLAKQIATPVIELSQLSRAVEARMDKRPMLSDLRDSGSIEQDSDVVIFLYRDEYYNPETERRGEAEIIIAKNRHGATGTVEMLFQNSITKFLEKRTA
ncbi:MAG TPA: replicative DNA helicase [Oculatellaceae cyanobacterium]